MNKSEDFNWLLNDIDNTLIFMLRDGKQMLGSYQVTSLRINGDDSSTVRFANIADLTNFASYATVRFTDSVNEENIIEIPLKELNKVYKACSEVVDSVPKGINLNEINSFAVVDGKVVKDGYTIYGYKIAHISLELDEILDITSNFDELSQNEKIDALEDINMINYQQNKKNKKR